MAEQTTAKKAAPKRKTTAKRKTAPKRKTTTQRKPAAKKAAPKRSAARTSAEDLGSRAQEVTRNAFLASLGVYGKAYDQAQERLDSLQGRLEKRRKDADKLYKSLVKRGQKVEKDARSAMDDIEWPKFDLDTLTDRKKLEAQLDKARARFEELKGSVGIKSAA